MTTDDALAQIGPKCAVAPTFPAWSTAAMWKYRASPLEPMFCESCVTFAARFGAWLSTVAGEASHSAA